MYAARLHDLYTLETRVPPAVLIEELIDKTTDPNHWLWNGDFYVAEWLGGEAPRVSQEAMFRWGPPGHRKSRFSVVRLLIQYQAGVSIHAGKITNVCGLSTCVDPSHWREVAAPVKTSAPKVITRGGKPGRKPGFSPGKWSDVHVVDFDRGGAITACGRTLDGMPRQGPARHRKTITTTGFKSQITCAACQRQVQLNTHWFFSPEPLQAETSPQPDGPCYVYWPVHSSYADTLRLPPRSYMDRFIDRSGDHWHWLASPSQEGAEIMCMWPFPVDKFRSEHFSVLRVLFRYFRNRSIPACYYFINKCGDLLCIHPNHWTPEKGERV